jgi:uncharacterized protein involved in outer membrane biogenesis
MDSKTSSPVATETPRRRGWTIAGGVVGVVALLLILLLALFDWDWLRGPIARYASARTGREVRIEGHLKVHPFSFSPTAEVGGLRIGNPAWAGAGDMAQVGALTVSVRLLPLLIGQIDLPRLELDHPRFDLIRDAQERANWNFGTAPSGAPPALPPIQRFVISGGVLNLHDAHRGETLSATVDASEGNGQQGFALVGQGTMNGQPFLLKVSGGPLIHVERSKPYPFHLQAIAGASRADVDGQLRRPFDMANMQGTLAISGPNMAALYPLTGVGFPGTPPYRLSTQFSRASNRYRFTGIQGTVGDSDLEGALTFDRVAGRRKVTGDLASRRLVFSDLLAVIGGGPKAAAVKASPSAPKPTPSGKLLPDAHLYKARLRTIDADLRYQAGSVMTGQWPLREFSLGLKLDQGLLTLDPLDFAFAKGRLDGSVRIDGRRDVPITDLDMRLSNVPIQQFLPSKGGQPPLEGLLQARAKLHGLGDTIHEAASTAQGRVVLVAPHGEVRQAFAELLGVNVANGLYLLLSKDNRQTDLRCAAADFNVSGGVMRVNHAVFDTDVVLATGRGDIDLANETLDLRLDGQPKKPRLLRVWAPITLKGTFLHPVPGIDVGKAAGQLGMAAALGAVLTPLAVLLPFVEPGLAKDADCSALINAAQAQGAPVKRAPARPVPAKSAPAKVKPD